VERAESRSRLSLGHYEASDRSEHQIAGKNRPAHRLGVELTKAVAIRRFPFGEIHSDCGGENRQERQRTNRAEPRCICREERQCYQHFHEGQTGSDWNRQLLWNAEANSGLPRTGEIGSLCCASEPKNKSQR